MSNVNAPTGKLSIIVTATYAVKQYNFNIERPNGDMISVKVFQAPYALWWVGQDNGPIDLEDEEVKGIDDYLRQIFRAKRSLQEARRQEYNENNNEKIPQGNG